MLLMWACAGPDHGTLRPRSVKVGKEPVIGRMEWQRKFCFVRICLFCIFFRLFFFSSVNVEVDLFAEAVVR